MLFLFLLPVCVFQCLDDAVQRRPDRTFALAEDLTDLFRGETASHGEGKQFLVLFR